MLIVLGRLNTDKIREILTIYTFRASYFHAVMKNTICSFTYVKFDANTIMQELIVGAQIMSRRLVREHSYLLSYPDPFLGFMLYASVMRLSILPKHPSQ